MTLSAADAAAHFTHDPFTPPWTKSQMSVTLVLLAIPEAIFRKSFEGSIAIVLSLQVILNGHEYVACQARQAGIHFTKEGNCFTHISDAAGLAKIADTLSDQRTIGRLRQAA